MKIKFSLNVELKHYGKTEKLIKKSIKKLISKTSEITVFVLLSNVLFYFV